MTSHSQDPIEAAFEAWWEEPSTCSWRDWRYDDTSRRVAAETWRAAYLAALAEAGKATRDTIDCSCGSFCECYGRSTLEKLAVRIEALAAPRRLEKEETDGPS